eukprot:CAMPEP_0206819914 /NCGR_PEP_ID=MMETSP0975-20121206/11552_1 /ASSEMBLY_ACC=CAM_ASM_000399 /TAXON_ID=483370 /ORGANISM="non described non described, Strain CCMP2097" /LENGTH=227 /DNA_ID=CAMNT_0054362149 /DNA_START=42 /DNA_END=721 /DNA_ORIENTATION=+
MAPRLVLLLLGLVLRSALCESDSDHYATLGLAPSASEKAVTKAYRERAKLYHPDKSKAPGAADKFRAVAEAYETLGDARLRHAYDAKQREERMYAQRGFQQHRQQRRQQRFVRVYRNGRVYEVPVEDEAFFFHQQSQPPHRGDADFLQQLLPALVVGVCFAFLGLTFFWQDADEPKAPRQHTQRDEIDRRPPENAQTASAMPLVVDSASSIRDLVSEARRRGLNLEG